MAFEVNDLAVLSVINLGPIGEPVNFDVWIGGDGENWSNSFEAEFAEMSLPWIEIARIADREFVGLFPPQES